jgi:hypothetical protein
MLYFAYEEPDWDGFNSPVYPVVYGIFTSLDKVIAYLASKPKEGYVNVYSASCRVLLISEDCELLKNNIWFDGVFVSGAWIDNEEWWSKEQKEKAETDLLKTYNANFPTKS